MGERPGRIGPAITDVARLAGVSHQTVSRVVNQHPHVREQTRLRVLAAIEELDYHPSGVARALATGRSTVLGVVTQNSTLFGPTSLLFGLEQAAALDFDIAVTTLRSLDGPALTRAVRRYIDQQVAGIVVIAPLVTARDALAELPGRVPIVLVDGSPEAGKALVTADQSAGARLATEHLLSLGHRNVWHVSGPKTWLDSIGRVDGWQAALRDAGVEPPPLIEGDWSPASGYRAGQLLARIPEATAVFAANDHMALGIIRAMHELNRRMPEQLSIVGFDDVPEAEYFTPALTTVRLDFTEIGRQALHLLREQMDTPDPVGTRVIQPALVIRDSAAAPQS
ncbi:MAG TPA: LacI family DNA-binding transcriptional regulator [Pseudonocardiaceae bacterium]|nr:LacI family DNA-binding transcriptional regulator [Pseudonocardiaceae bacterium]